MIHLASAAGPSRLSLRRSALSPVLRISNPLLDSFPRTFQPTFTTTTPGNRPQCHPASSIRIRHYATGSAKAFPTLSRRSPFRPIHVVVLVIPLFTFVLGTWQVRRLRWKEALIEEVEKNLEREPMIMPKRINISALPDFAFRRVLLAGHYTSPVILLGTKTYQGTPGYNLILPFVRSEPDSSIILVNRGFVTKTVGEAIRAGSLPVPGLDLTSSVSGTGQRLGSGSGSGSVGNDVYIEGMVVKNFSSGKGRFTIENSPEKGEWYWRDAEAMARYCGGEERGVQAVMVDVIDRGAEPASYLMQQGIPIGTPPQVEIRNQHAQYAAIWFSLSGLTTVMLGLLLRRRRMEGIPLVARRVRQEV